MSIQIGDDAIFALIQVKYGQKARAKQFDRVSSPARAELRMFKRLDFPEGERTFLQRPTYRCHGS